MTSTIRISVIAIVTAVYAFNGCDHAKPPSKGQIAEVPTTRQSSHAPSELSSNNQENSPWPTELESFQYSYSPKVFGGSATTLGLNRSGYVSYSYSSQPHTGSGGDIVAKEWHIPEHEAKRILDALVEAGLLQLGTDGSAKFPFHGFTVSSKGWQKPIRPTSFPDEIWRQILPLMMNAHPEKWKNDSQPEFQQSRTNDTAELQNSADR